MKLTKKSEAEIKQVMADYWASYFAGDLNHWANYLVDNYRNIGGTEEEIWNSKKEILDYTHRIIDQMKGATELRNKQTQIIPYDPYIMVHELLDIYIKVENKWSFYQKFRLSSLIQKTVEGWKVLHQHGSYPDSKTNEGEAFAFDTLKSENKKLQKAIEERTLELQQKNNELTIEVSLEKVRARSLAMHNTSELQEVIYTVHKELLNLNIAIHGGSFIAINKDIDNTLRIWGAGGTADTTEEVHLPLYEKPFCTNLISGIKKGSGFLTEEYTQKEKKEFFKFLFQHEPWSKLNDKEKEKTLSTSGGYTRACCVSQHTSIFIVNHFGEKFSDADNEILQRFGKVFEQAYTRFLDLQKAEAQTREAQIETAVERVRAQSMAMYKTSDLYKVNEEILSQLNKLTVTGLTGVSIYLVDENDVITVWDLSSPGNISNPNSYSFKYDSKKYPVLGGWVGQWKTSNEDYFVLDFPKKVLIDGVKELEEILPEMAVLLNNAIESRQLNHQWNPAGRLADGILSVDLIVPPTEDTKSIITKMAGAFNLAYQRFLDLQKAEAQTREAQINLAVERVRARALAMFKSEEILEVVFKLKEEVMNLNIPGVAAASILLKEKNGMFRNWDLTSMDLQDESMHIASDIIFDLDKTHPNFYLRKVWEKGKKYTVVEQDAASLDISIKWLRENDKIKEADEAEGFIKSAGIEKVYHPTIPLNTGRLCLDLLQPPKDEIESILSRQQNNYPLRRAVHDRNERVHHFSNQLNIVRLQVHFDPSDK